MVKKLAIALVISLALLIALTACAPHKGFVTDKRHSEGHYYTSTTCHTSGKSTICTPHMNYVPESWALDLRNGKEHGWRSVTENAYNGYNVGDFYSDGKE